MHIHVHETCSNFLTALSANLMEICAYFILFIFKEFEEDEEKKNGYIYHDPAGKSQNT